MEAGGGTAPERIQPTAASRSSTRHHRSDRGPASDTMLSHDGRHSPAGLVKPRKSTQPDFLFFPICPKPQSWFTVLECNGRRNVCQLRPVATGGEWLPDGCAIREATRIVTLARPSERPDLFYSFSNLCDSPNQRDFGLFWRKSRKRLKASPETDPEPSDAFFRGSSFILHPASFMLHAYRGGWRAGDMVSPPVGLPSWQL